MSGEDIEYKAGTAQFRPGPELREWLTGRAARQPVRPTSIGKAAEAELELWRKAMRQELARTPFAVAELTVIAGIANTTSVGASPSLRFEVVDALTRHPDIWGIDAAGVDALIAKVSQVGPTEDLAISDALARFHTSGLDGRDPQTWRALGFRVIA